MRSVEVIASRFTSNKVPGRLESPSKEESKSKSQSPTQSALSHPALNRVRTRWFPAVQSSILLWCLPYPPQKCCPDFQLGHPPPQELQDLEKNKKKTHTHKSWGIVSLMGWSFRILENKSNHSKTIKSRSNWSSQQKPPNNNKTQQWEWPITFSYCYILHPFRI